MCTTPLQFFLVPGSNEELILVGNLREVLLGREEVQVIGFITKPIPGQPNSWQRVFCYQYPLRLVMEMKMIDINFIPYVPILDALPPEFYSPYEAERM